MRSLLLVPADHPERCAEALESGADAVIIDLVSPTTTQEKARATLAEVLPGMARGNAALHVRINDFTTDEWPRDLQAALAARPDGIVLPGAENGAMLTRLDALLRPLEARHGLKDGAIAILATAAATPAALFGLGSMAGASQRLKALTWEGDDLAAALDLSEWRAAGGIPLLPPLAMARALLLFAAHAAGVAAIDAAFADPDDSEGLKREAAAAARDGFTGKLAIHPAQVPVINDVFTRARPSAPERC